MTHSKTLETGSGNLLGLRFSHLLSKLLGLTEEPLDFLRNAATPTSQVKLSEVCCDSSPL